MTQLPQPGYKVTATVTEIKGKCNAGMKVGDTFPLCCRNSGNICGFFYYAIFADLQTFEFGGKLPWWEDDVIELGCPDFDNQVVLRLEREQAQDYAAPATSVPPFNRQSSNHLTNIWPICRQGARQRLAGDRNGSRTRSHADVTAGDGRTIA